MAGLRPAGRRRHALLPMRGGGCGGAIGHPRNAAAPLGMGEVRRTPPHADSPHSSRLTRWGGTGTAASKPLPFQRAPPTQTSLARAGGSSMSRGRGESPATAGDSKLSRPRSNAPGWAEGRIFSMLLNLGVGGRHRRGRSPCPVFHPSSTCSTHSPGPLQRVSFPSWRLTPPPPPGCGSGCCSRSNEPSFLSRLQAAPVTGSPPSPPPPSLGPRGGALWCFGS